VIRLLRVNVVLLVCAVALATHAAIAADQPALDPRTACATNFAATKIAGDPNSVVVRITDPVAPPAGTITAYGRDTMWTATIGRSVEAQNQYGVREASFTVRADAPIEGIVYAPAWAPCTFHAGVFQPDGYTMRDVERPVLTLTNPVPAEPAHCARPYAPPTVEQAFEPITPFAASAAEAEGTVRVAVALDEHGLPRFSRIVSTANGLLNRPATNSAMRSTYSPAVFRCIPVPSGYEFAVQFNVGR
jgi:hypothetical protein